MSLLLLIGFWAFLCLASTRVSLEVMLGTMVNDSLPLVALIINSRRFPLPDCVALPSQANVTVTPPQDLFIFAYDEMARAGGVDGVLRDTDLVSGVNKLTSDSRVVVQFGRELTADDLIVVVDVNSPNSFSVQGALATSSQLGPVLLIGDGEYGVEPEGTGIERSVPLSNRTGFRNVSRPHAVAFSLHDLGLMAMEVVTGIVISNAFGLDLTFVGLVDTSCLVLPATLPPTAASTSKEMTTTLLQQTTSMSQIIVIAVPTVVPVAIVAGSVTGAIVLCLAAIGLATFFVCKRPRREQQIVSLPSARPSEYASTSLSQQRIAYDDVGSVRQQTQQQTVVYESVSAPLTL